MEYYDIRRLALVFSKIARMESMKIENEIRKMAGQAPAYGEQDFTGIQIDLENLAYCHNEQL